MWIISGKASIQWNSYRNENENTVLAYLISESSPCFRFNWRRYNRLNLLSLEPIYSMGYINSVMDRMTTADLHLYLIPVSLLWKYGLGISELLFHNTLVHCAAGELHWTDFIYHMKAWSNRVPLWCNVALCPLSSNKLQVVRLKGAPAEDQRIAGNVKSKLKLSNLQVL